jgi:hypothetical protein
MSAGGKRNAPLFQEILSHPAGKEFVFPAGKVFPPEDTTVANPRFVRPFHQSPAERLLAFYCLLSADLTFGRGRFSKDVEKVQKSAAATSGNQALLSQLFSGRGERMPTKNGTLNPARSASRDCNDVTDWRWFV